MHEPVLTKADFVRRYEQGEFGNHSLTWNTLYEWQIDKRVDPLALYHIRNRTPGGPTWYNIHAGSIRDSWNYLTGYGNINPTSLYLSQMAPMHNTLIQGEVMRWTNVLYLTYSLVPLPMREALAQSTKVAEGIIALELLRTFMCPKSYEWLWYLLEEYEDHVVEFTTFNQEWGTVSGFNTVWWEVRKY